MINISADDAKLFEQNGFTKEQVQATVQHYREQGLSDADIQAKMDAKIGVFRENNTLPQTTLQKASGIDLTPSGLVKQGVATVAAPIRGAMYGEDFKTARQNALQNVEKFKPAKGVGDFIVDVYGYSQLPILRTAGGPGKLAGLGRFVGNAAIQGGVPGGLESLKAGQNPLGGLAGGSAIAAGLNTVASGVPYVGKGVQRFIENPKVQRAINRGVELMTSVPEKLSNIALQNELNGTSIIGKSFNPEIGYQPVEKLVREAKAMLPTASDFGNEYYKLGQKATQGIEDLEQQAAQEIQQALEPLNNKEVSGGGIQNAVKGIIDSFGKGGVYNSALEESPGLVNYVNNALNKEGLTLMDLHRIKEALYQKGYAAAAAKEGTTAQVARGIANQINNYLRRLSPGYAKPNDVYGTIQDVVRGLDGQSTMGGKLKNIGSTNSAISGLDQRLKAIDNLLPQQNKFYKKALDIIKSENEINEINNMITRTHERNPRLLANRTDERFNQALNDLQNKTGVNITDTLDKIMADEAFSKVLPGQGGGSGSIQGAGNLSRTGIFLKSLDKATKGDFTPLAATLLMSPIIGGKGTIKNIGKIYKKAKDLENAGNKLKSISPSVNKLMTTLLYGGITND